MQHAPNQSITYFEVFGLYEHDPGGSEQYLTNYSDAKFELDSGELDHRFKQMQKMVHPDLYGGRSEVSTRHPEPQIHADLMYRRSKMYLLRCHRSSTLPTRH